MPSVGFPLGSWVASKLIWCLRPGAHVVLVGVQTAEVVVQNLELRHDCASLMFSASVLYNT